MPRNPETIRQWQLLRALEGARQGASIHELAGLTGVTTRTIRRDLAALQDAGFPLFDERQDGQTRWKLAGDPLKGLQTTFTFAELCALYFSRSLLECLASTPFRDDLARAFDRVEAVLSPRMKAFVDRLPRVISAKSGPVKIGGAGGQQVVTARLLDALLGQRRVCMRYDSVASGRTREYVIDPYRLVYAQGGLYLFAYVPAYAEVRTFALERVRHLVLLDERFVVREAPPAEAFAHSLGIHDGAPERVVLEVSPAAAPSVRERQWHASQRVETRPDGSLLLSLDVCLDVALRRFVLSLGSGVRVLEPAILADDVRAELGRALDAYGPAAAATSAPAAARIRHRTERTVRRLPAR